jgi:3',5'-cyclic AMP phosphodiesterase CpdA
MPGRFDGDVFRAARSGSGDVFAKERGIHSRADLTVLDDLAELAFDRPSVSLQPGAEVRVRLIGEDDEGFAAPIEPDDAALEYDHDVIDVTCADGALLAAEPDLVLISGDGVDTNRPEDFAFYEGLIDDYLPGIPVHWVPGNHESGATSGGTLANFTQGTGRPARETFDHKGIRFITMNSHLGSFRLSYWSQLAALRAQLDDAAADPAIEGVVVVDHHPPADPSGGDASKLSDALEAGLLRRWLADFRESSGKQVALYSGHAHTAAVNRTDGLLEVNAPSVGKQPYGAADRGGFFGWQLVGVERDPERLRAGRPDRRASSGYAPRFGP